MSEAHGFALCHHCHGYQAIQNAREKRVNGRKGIRIVTFGTCPICQCRISAITGIVESNARRV